MPQQWGNAPRLHAASTGALGVLVSLIQPITSSSSTVHSVNSQASVSALNGALHTLQVFGSLENPATVFLAIRVVSFSIGDTLAG